MKIGFLMGLLWLGGCASQMDAMRGVADDAPEWFQDRRTEIAGEDYPDIQTIPSVTTGDRPSISTNAARTPAELFQVLFATNARAALPTTTAADITAWARTKRAVFAGLVPPTQAERPLFPEAPPVRGTGARQ